VRSEPIMLAPAAGRSATFPIGRRPVAVPRKLDLGLLSDLQWTLLEQCQDASGWKAYVIRSGRWSARECVCIFCSETRQGRIRNLDTGATR
jgi:hypothetical protein